MKLFTARETIPMIGGLALLLQGCSSNAPQLKVHPESVTVTREEGVEDQIAVVTLLNVGDQPLEVRGVRTSCNCTVAELPDDLLIEGRGQREIRLKVSPPVYGTSESTVTIVTNSKMSPEFDLKIKLNGSEREIPCFTGSTQSLLLSSRQAGEELSGTLEIRTIEYEDEICWIKSVDPEDGRVTSTLKTPVEEATLGGGVVTRCYTFEITTICPTSGRFSTRLIPKVHQSPLDGVPATNLIVEHQRPVRIVPDLIELPADALREPFDVLIVTDEQEPFSLESITLVSGDHEVDMYSGPSADARFHRVSLVFQGGVEFPMSSDSFLKIQTSVAELPELVPINFILSR